MTNEKQPEKELTDEEKRQTLNEIQQSILGKTFGKRFFEHLRRKWHRYYSPKAQKRRRAKRLAVKKARRQSRKK